MKSEHSPRFVLSCMIVLIGMLFLPSLFRKDFKNEYEELQEKYDRLAEVSDSLQSKYEKLIERCDTLETENSSLQEDSMQLYSIRESAGSLEDDSATVFCFFEEDEEITFAEAKAAYERMDQFIDSIIDPE